MRPLSVLLMCLALSISCKEQRKPDLQGHRGARGLMPENTVPAFIRAVDLGVSTLEMDLAVTSDGQLVVSHEPFMSAEICLSPGGDEIPDSVQHSLNIYQMTYEEVSAYDCGSKFHPRFPDQEKMKVRKPLLTEVIDTVEAYLQANHLRPVSYNIELKSSAKTDTIYHPAPAGFSDLVYGEISKKLPWSRVIIQSFDFRILQYFHARYPEVKLALLIENELPFRTNLDSLGFSPDIYSCYYALLSREQVDQLHTEGIKVIPWTVNEKQDMKKMIDWGVDGLITDYPDRFFNLRRNE